MRTRKMFSLIFFILFGAFLLLGPCKPAKGQSLPSGVHVPPQEGCSEAVKSAYLNAGLERAEHEAKLWAEGRNFRLVFWTLDTLGYFPEGMGDSASLRSDVLARVQKWKGGDLGSEVYVVLFSFTDADHSASTREQDFTDDAALQFGRWSTYKKLFAPWAIGSPLVQRVNCRDPFFQGVVIYVFRAERINPKEPKIPPHDHDGYALKKHQHKLVPDEEAVVKLSGIWLSSYNWIDCPGVHVDAPAYGFGLRLSTRKLGPLSAVTWRFAAEGERELNVSRRHRIEFDEIELEFWRFLEVGLANVSVREVRMPENAYTHRFEGIGPYLGIRLGCEPSLWNTGQFRMFLGFDAQGSAGVLWGKAVRPQDLTEQSETATRLSVGLHIRVGIAFHEGGVQ